jgi:SAM-dependent methyltransferase
MATTTLDLGCGPNPQNPYNADEVYGLDIRELGNPRIRSADLFVQPIPGPDCEFDYITAFHFIEHLPRVLYVDGRTIFPFVRLMSEVYRKLKPGGLFMSATPSFPHPQAWQDPTHVNIITQETFPVYFAGPEPTARIYGFRGGFEMVKQEQRAHVLFSELRRPLNPSQGEAA